MLPYLLREWLVCCNPVVKHAGIQVWTAVTHLMSDVTDQLWDTAAGLRLHHQYQ